MTPEAEHTSSWTLETLSPIGLEGRIIDLNSMLVGLQASTFKKNKPYNCVSFPGEISDRKHADLGPQNFSELWDGLISSSSDPTCQRELLIEVFSWMHDDEIEKTPLETISCSIFLTTANSFNWEENPDILKQMQDTMRHIGDAHAEVQRRAAIA